jgi:hypothetical protein
MFSLYRSLLGKGVLDGSFEAAVTRRLNGEHLDWHQPQLHLEFAFYYEPLQRYVDVFGDDRVKVLIFEELARDPAGVMATVARFLGLSEPSFNDKLRPYNQSAMARSRLARSVLANQTITQPQSAS